MSPCGRALHTSRGAMAVLARKFPRTRLPVGASALCVVVLCWLYIFPVYRLPNEKEIVQGVLAQRTAWRTNQTSARLFRYLLAGRCPPPAPSLLVCRSQGRTRGFSVLCPLCRAQPRNLGQGLCPIPHPKETFQGTFTKSKICYLSLVLAVFATDPSLWEGRPRTT